MRIVIEVDETKLKHPGFGDARTMIHATIADALGEFIGARLPAEEYVARRYAGPGYGWVNVKEKIASVKARIALAEAMAQAVQLDGGS